MLSYSESLDWYISRFIGLFYYWYSVAIYNAPVAFNNQVVNNPVVRHHCCYLRLEFMPRDFSKLSRTDPEAFQYLYIQCVNDVVAGLLLWEILTIGRSNYPFAVAGDRYKNDLTHEDFVKLAVLQMQELVMSAIPSTPPDMRPSSSSSNESPFQRNSFRFPGLSNKLNLKYFEYVKLWYMEIRFIWYNPVIFFWM